MPDIIGVGDLNIDIMIEVDHPPRHDEKVRGREFHREVSGMSRSFRCCGSG